MHLFPIFKEKDRSKTAWWEDASLAQSELNLGACLYVVQSGLICIHHRVRMCQRVCLLPCLASVTAVYIGPDGGGNSAQLLSSPRLHTEQWTEQVVVCIHNTHTAEFPQFQRLGLPEQVHGTRVVTVGVRLFQLNMNTNQTWFHAGLLRTASPQSKHRNASDLGLLRLKSAVCFFLHCFRVCSYQPRTEAITKGSM